MGIKVKQKLGERVVSISEELQIPKNTVEAVIRSYLNSLIESNERGETMVIDNIVSISVVDKGDKKALRSRVSPALKSRVGKVLNLDEEEV